MACNLIDGQVLNNEGAPSKLYQKAAEQFGQTKAMDIFLASQSTQFLEEFGETEQSLQTVLKFITEKNQSTEPLTAEQKVDLQNISLSIPNFSLENLVEIFYNDQGLFEINSVKLKAYYSPFEIQNMQDDISLQVEVKQAVEALKNNSGEIQLVEVEFENIEKTAEINSWGKLNNLNPYAVQRNSLEQVVGEDFDAVIGELPYLRIDKEILRQDAQQYVKAQVFMDVDGRIIPSLVTNTQVVLPLTAKISQPLQSIETILNVDLDVLQENIEDTRKVLENIEDTLIEVGIDVLGLADKPIDAALKNFLSQTQEFLFNPDSVNTQSFIDILDTYFERDLQPKMALLKIENQSPVYIQLHTKLGEEQVYEQTGLIKAGENLYIQTAKENLETLYSNIASYTGKYPTDQTLEQYVEAQLTGQTGFQNADNAEAVFLYKMYFDVQNDAVVDNIGEGVNFTGDRQYLTGDYVSDFYVDYLKEKKKDSAKWKNFYSNFEINAQGINLINVDPLTLAKVELYMDDNLIQYSLLSTQMPNLQTAEETLDHRRDRAINNPMTIEEFKGQLYNLEQGEIILKNGEKEFIRIGKNVFENIDSQGNLSLYSLLPQNNSDYNIFNVEQPQTQSNLRAYTYLENDESGFTDAKNYLKSTEKEKTNNEKYNCR